MVATGGLDCLAVLFDLSTNRVETVVGKLDQPVTAISVAGGVWEKRFFSGVRENAFADSRRAAVCGRLGTDLREEKAHVLTKFRLKWPSKQGANIHILAESKAKTSSTSECSRGVGGGCASGQRAGNGVIVT